ncbi:hypothetical protein GCM10010168_20900 [Actinoplanes ianthinogenes]|uniref:KaiB domain-containing protein n=1 Tax=Actinoplanes ianthinogenes TaxID=122358 RepID=A0ABM7M7V4_9ACTN|nr:circadian clock KaiB family protein [Actinoplanes ianthinogenes]BCJ47731.1 hypothetical protein Aiant_83880 [Actinoplanes ianthinogenes]GGR03777.1 hypothetical protein GCM10010168_20900 [Actinoplanes ianthinogenes]
MSPENLPTGGVDRHRERDAAEQTVYLFRLCIAGGREQSAAAEVNLRAVCNSRLPGRYQVEIVDTVDRPDLAERYGILATPTVIRLAPLPQLRVIGDLSDRLRLALALGIPDLSTADGSSHD